MYISRESIPVLIKELEHIAEIYQIQISGDGKEI
jgi:hypothetical protein